MTNKEKAIALMAIVMDRDNNDTIREQALDDLTALKVKAKASYEALGVSPEMVKRERGKLIERKAIAVDVEEVEAPPVIDILAGEPNAKIDSRGALSRFVRELLMTYQTYHAIMMACVDKFPTCSTTQRSIASVASEMRKAGVNVPLRRKEKKLETV